MSDSIVKAAMIEVEPLSAEETVGNAARRLVELGLPGLPAVEADGSFAGIFGEREFMTALSPAMSARSPPRGSSRRRSMLRSNGGRLVGTSQSGATSPPITSWSKTNSPTRSWPNCFCIIEC